MYATLSELVIQYGLTELAQLLDDEAGLISPELLQAALDNDVGSFTPEEQAAIARATARAEGIINQQQTLIDASAARRYPVPLSEEIARATPVHSCCMALARAALADDGDNISEQMSLDRDYWRTWLRDLAAGRALLPGVAVTASGSSTRQHRLTGRARSSIDWGRFDV